jgi:hypothetical protein
VHADVGVVDVERHEWTVDIDTRHKRSEREASTLWIRNLESDAAAGYRLAASPAEHMEMGNLLDAMYSADILAKSVPYDPKWQAVPPNTRPTPEQLVRMRITFDGPDGDKRQVAWSVHPEHPPLPPKEQAVYLEMANYMHLIEQDGEPLTAR